uniref:Tetraspanin n=1 Tax=Tabanus bromius TaxID=304241 RepID=A0A0K8TKK9_TABBR
MGLNNCCVVVKYLMVLVNLLFWLIGLVIVGLSIWILTDPTFLFSMTLHINHFYVALYICLAVGALMLIVAFFGCCGAFRESQCLLISFFCCLLVVLVAEIAGGAWIFHNREKLDDMVRSSVKYTVQEEYGPEFTKTTSVFDTFQRQLKCCGADSPQDWSTSKFNDVERPLNLGVGNVSKKPYYKVPDSCCKENIDEKVCYEATKILIGGQFNDNLNKQGCMDKLLGLVRDHWTTILIVALTVVLLEVAGLIFSLGLCCAIKNNDHYKA